MSDGSSLRQSWSKALHDAEAHFRQLLTSSTDNWRRVSNPADLSSTRKGKARASTIPDLADVIVHRYSNRGGEISRLILDVPAGDHPVSLDPWRAVLTTPELRSEWDPAVEEAHLLEMFDHTTRISKTNFTLGWPAGPRDAVTISRTFHDPNVVLDITTSLPRSPDEPAYLRPSPPFVRSHVSLFAWFIQHIQPAPPPHAPNDKIRRTSSSHKIRISCFWQHDLKLMWNMGASSSLTQQLSTMVLGLFKTVLKSGTHVAKLTGYGSGISIERIRFQIDREALTVDYAIVPEDDEHGVIHGMDEVHALREQQRLTRSIECILPLSEGWDIRVSTKASSPEVEQLPWSTHAIRSYSSHSANASDQIVFRVSHAALIDEHSVLKVKVVIERSGPTSGLRLNGIPQSITQIEDRDPLSQLISEHIFQDVSSAVDLSFATASSLGTVDSLASTSVQTLVRPMTERTAAADKLILSQVRRNYIYFSSLLQEPEAKWRRTTEARGVSITQLDSIDPTLVVYRAEAIFVGVGIWDLFATIVTPGSRVFWDKQHEDAVLLEDVNELTELWHFKTRPTWPANGRDAVVLKTVYKSPTAIHVFSFSTDDAHLFTCIPPTDPNYLRIQVDLQGWSIEALSPTTTQLTLLDQTDPKGWTGKASIPTQMINLLAGIGEFAIRCGGPPVKTRLSGAKAKEIRYDHEKSSFRIEYEAAATQQNATTAGDDNGAVVLPMMECEVRCDVDTWAPSLDIVVDPPPQTFSCLRRHRLSTEGGGLWFNLMHDAMIVDDDRLQVIVRRAPGKERGLVMVNGAKVAVDVEELSEVEIKALMKQKRVKQPRIPLDQPPMLGAIRRRRAEWDADGEGGEGGARGGCASMATGTWASAPQIPSPLTRWFNSAMENATMTTQQAVAAISPAGASGSMVVPSAGKMPMQYALEALAWVQDMHSLYPSAGWEAISSPDKSFSMMRKVAPEICPVIPVHKGTKVIEGVSAEELAVVVMGPGCRREWDDRWASAQVFESFGGEVRTAFVVNKTGFPWRDRGFYLANVMARGVALPSVSRRASRSGEVAEQSNGMKNAIFCVSASFSPESVAQFDLAKYNPHILPVGRVYVDAWILETLDPYTKENYAIPSTRCTRLVAVDFAGSIPAAVNTMINITLPRAVLALERFVKGFISHPLTRLPAPVLVITENKSDEHLKNVTWKLKKKDENRLLVDTKYVAGARVYTATVLVKVPRALADPERLRSPSTPASDLATADDTTPRPSTIIPGGLGPSVAFQEPPSHVPEGEKTTEGSAIISNLSNRSTPPLPSPPATAHSFSRDRSPSHSAPPVMSASSNLYTRGRTVSLAFTKRGEVRPSTDLIVAELVIESKLYPEGYDVVLTSAIRSKWKVGQREGFIPLRAGSKALDETSSGSSSSLSGTDKASSLSSPGKENMLPLAYTIHTMPSSPPHSSTLLEGESPTRHLLRLSLPTAQYQISTVRDPLTGELRSPPPAPTWLQEMREGGAVVFVEVRPRMDVGSATAQGSGDRTMKVRVDGNEVKVVGEKEALMSLGREELLDDRVSKMSVLSRVPSEAEPLPEELKVPVAIADDLLNLAMLADPTTHDPSSKEIMADKASSEIGDTASDRQTADHPPSSLSTPHVPHVASSGLLGFLNSYNNTLSRFTNGVTATTSDTNTSTSTTNVNNLDGAKGNMAAPAKPNPPLLPGSLGNAETAETTVNSMDRRRLYPMSTLLVVAVIAFLIGSLLRSLLSPADFIYMVTDLKEVERGSIENGWREIRRLLEVKYLIGGWDFQVAVVRRH